MDWFRSHHGAPTDPKWLVVARKAKVSPALVVAVFWTILDYASQQESRGSIEGFDPESAAAFLGIEDEEIGAILAAMEGKNIIGGGRITNWEKRQVKREREDDSAERVRRHREAQKASAATVTPCNATVTPRNTQIRLDKSREEKSNVSSLRSDTPPNPQRGQDACEADEEPTDAFTPEELTVPPMPRRQSRREREKANEETNQKRLALMVAFRSARFGRPATDPVPPAEFDRMKAAADDLIAIGATTEQVQAATEKALLEWQQDSMVTLRAVSGNWTALTSASKTQSKPAARTGFKTAAQLAEEERMRSSAQFFADLERELLDAGAISPRKVFVS